MENLRATCEADLSQSLEGEWKMNVELTNPDGIMQIYSKNNPAERLGGQVLYFSTGQNPTTGETIVNNLPVVTLRVSSLDRVPLAGEKWLIKIPISPVIGAAKQTFVFTTDKAPEHGTDIGFIKIYPQKIENESGPETLDDVISYS